MKKATTAKEQIAILKERGLIIESDQKAEEILLDIGYFRLGLYCKPFMKASDDPRQPVYTSGTRLRDVVGLYYFDSDLRNILLKYLYRIEINFRTKLVYIVSNIYKDSPTWFVDPAIVDHKYVRSFDKKVYSTIRQYEEIDRHHKRHINDKYAPAWKTIEFMTFGAAIKLYEAILNEDVKRRIAAFYKIEDLSVFRSYLRTIRNTRNICSHGNVLFGRSLPTSIAKGPAGELSSKERHNLIGVISVILYMIGEISKNRRASLCKELQAIFEDAESIPIVVEIGEAVRRFL